ncbi:MAG TPA: DsbA family oxidoreductase [Chondromyces sp.]|nr:DsbA family oxidoreductase [Chondromyces sp.]
MRIEVWSDFVCPFCYIGKRRLEDALRQFDQRDKVEVMYRSFELDPQARKEHGKSIHELLAAKYGMSLEQARQANEGVGRQAKEVGLDFRFDTMIPTNTFDAHRLAKFAEREGKGKEITERLLKAYFTDSKDLGDKDTLADLAEEMGLNRTKVEGVLASNQFATEVRDDEQEAYQIGVKGVPFFVFNQKYAVSGAQPTEVFVNVLEKVWQEENAAPVLQDLTSGSSATAFCTDEGCELPDEGK